MIDIGNTLDGSVEKAIAASEKLNEHSSIFRKIMLAGDFSLGNAKKIDVVSYKSGSRELMNYIAQVTTLDQKQRDIVLSMSNINDTQKDYVNFISKRISEGKDLNGVIVEQVLKENDFSKAAVEGLTAINGLKDANGKYGIAVTSQTIPAMEAWINEHTTAIDVTKMLNDNIITGTEGNYQFTDSFKDLIIQKQKDVAVTKQLTTEQMFWNAALQIGKQLLVSFAIGAFIAAIQKGIQAWKDYRDRFVNGMNDAHDAAEEAKADVDSIQAKIDELNEKVKAAGANKISDIVDPAERAKLQETNDQLEKQLKLKQQIQETEEQEEHDNAVGVYNTKDETVYKDADGNYDYSMGINTDSAGYKATGTEALDYYASMLNEYTEKYNNLLSTVGEDDSQTKAAKEQMDFAKDEVVRLSKSLEDLQGHLKDTSDEYSAVSTALDGASDALSYYNGEVDVTHQESALGKQLRIEQGQLDKATKAYKKYSELKEHYGKYGNIDNFNRGIIEWNDENLAKYSEYAKENGVHKGEYSTVNGASKGFEANGKEIQIAYTPMLQTDDGDVMPLTANTIEEYIWSCIDAASEMDGGATAENILKVDKEGIYEDIDGVETRIHDMIGAVEGQILNGAKLSALDVIAIAGATEEELGDEFGNQWSKYFGYSMHDVQSQAVDLCKVIKSKWNDIWSDGIDTSKFNEQLSNSGNIQNALNLLGGKPDAEYLKAIGQAGTKTKEQAAAFEILNSVAERLHTTYDKLIDAMEEESLIAPETVIDTTAMNEASENLDKVQAAYKTLKSAQEEYNKQGYLTTDTLQSIINLDPKYQACLVEENGKLNINKGTIKNLTNSYYELMKAKVYSQAIDDLKEMKTYKQAADFLAQAKAETKDWLALMQATANATLEASGLSGEGWDKLNEAQQARIRTAQSMVNLITKTQAQSIDKQFADSSSKTKKASKTALDAWSSLTSAMKEYNEQGYITFQTLKSLTDLEDKYSSMLKKNDVTGQLEMRTDDFYKLMKAELKEAQIKGDGASEAQYNKILKWTNRNIKNQTMSYWDLVAAIEGYSAALSEAKDITDTFKDAWSNGKTVKEKQEKSRAGALDYEGTEAQSSALQDLMKYSEYDPELIGKAFNKETGKIDLSGDVLKTAVTKSLKQYAAAARTEGGAAAEAIAASYEKSAENIENDVISVQDFFDGLGSTIEEVSSKIDEVQSAFTDLDDIKDEYDIYGGLSVDSLQKLLTMSPDYIACLEMEGDQLIFNRDKMVELLIAQLESKKEFLLSKEETKDQAEIIQKIIDALRKNGVNALAGMNYQAEKFKSALSDAKDILSSFLSLLSSANDKSNNDLKIWGDAMGKVIDKRIEALNKQKEALEENNEATERAIELSKAQDALARAQQQRTTRVYTENGYEWQANAEDVRTAREDLADKQREWNKKDAEKAIDDQIKKYNEFKDKLSEVMDDIGKSWKDYQKELEYTAQIQKMTLTQMEGSLDGYHNKIIASLNTGSAITGIQNLITNLESLINTLTKLNNLYSMFKTGEYKDLGTKGLWNTIKGFLNNGGEKAASSGTSYVNAAKQAVNAVKTTLVDTATETGTALKNILTTANNNITKQVVSSGNGIINAFTNIWNTIKGGAQSLFGGSGEGGGIVSTVVNGFKAVGNAVSKSKIGSTILGGIGKVGTTLLSGGGKLLAGAGKLIGTAGSALAAAGPAAIPILAAGGLGIYGGTKAMKNQKKIWSNKEDGFGKKAIKSVASFFWDISPIGGIVNLCKDIFGKSKETAENTKDTANSSSETAENTQKSATNLTINATQIVSKEENKATDETDKKNDATANEDKTVKTAATTLTGAGLGAAAGMAVGGPVGALIGTLLGGFAGFFLGGHANGLKSSKTNHFANVDERGSELIVRKPASGRYTYLETGDGVVPADITSRLFEMGGNPDKWFSDQLAKHSSASMVQSRDAGGISLSIGDVNVNNPVGDSDALARELVNRLPNKVVQELNRR
jgi:hypothetical protein